MTASQNPTELPKDLPVPVDDGGAKHLPGMHLPAIPLRSTAQEEVSLSVQSERRRVVVYCYPMTGRPGHDLPKGWNEIPGARGCTPEACAFRDHFGELQDLHAQVFGLSTQTTDYQQEAVQRLHLPFALLSDADLRFTRALRLPTFDVEGKTLLKRLTLVCFRGKIQHVFYPVFPPDQHAAEVVGWLGRNPPAA